MFPSGRATSLCTQFKARWARGWLVVHATLLEIPDGKILVGGRFGSLGGRNTGPLVRLHPSGALDTTFRTFYEPLTPEKRVRQAINEIYALPGGNIGRSGNFHAYLGEPAWEGFMVLDSAGGPNPEVLRNLAKAGFVIKVFGSIAVMGDKYGSLQILRRFAPAGTVDEVSLSDLFFRGRGDPDQIDQFASSIRSVLPLPGGGLVVGGCFIMTEEPYRQVDSFCRLDKEGRVDTAFSARLRRGRSPFDAETSPCMDVLAADRLPGGGVAAVVRNLRLASHAQAEVALVRISDRGEIQAARW